MYLIEILHQTTTSFWVSLTWDWLYLIEILHQTTTLDQFPFPEFGCILSKFYIKPQLAGEDRKTGGRCILSKFYIKPQRLSGTSRFIWCCILSKFYIKPQLRLERELARCSCILSKFYIKPQHLYYGRRLRLCCILSKFYIKPQLEDPPQYISRVVSYRNSTSNHNLKKSLLMIISVVSYRNSTSNHNSGVGVNATMSLYLIEILHQTTT